MAASAVSILMLATGPQHALSHDQRYSTPEKHFLFLVLSSKQKVDSKCSENLWVV